MNADRARILARIAHKGQWYGKKGTYYSQHILHVVGNLMLEFPAASEEDRQVAYLHDIVEDTNVTLMDLVHFGFSENVVTSVVAITKNVTDTAETYEGYIKRVAKDESATRVKIADLRHNLANKPKKKNKEKYEKALSYLLSSYEEEAEQV